MGTNALQYFVKPIIQFVLAFGCTGISGRPPTKPAILLPCSKYISLDFFEISGLTWMPMIIEQALIGHKSMFASILDAIDTVRIAPLDGAMLKK